MDETKIVTVMNFTSVNRAELAKSLLDAAGIASQIINDTSAQMIPSLPNSVRIIVNEQDAARAEEVLRKEINE